MIKLVLEIFSLFISIFMAYAILPTVFIRMSGRGISKRTYSDAVAITFDDGPNPIYTPQLLELLKKYGVKATFFVVGSKAKAYPDIIKRMSLEGHTIGIHHFDHVSSWLLLPFRLKKQLQLTEQTIQECTNQKVMFYRPPWGHFNIFSLLLSKPYKVIMWSHIFGDWKIEKSKNGLLKQLHASTEPGSIFLLHDCGETPGADREAPGYMLQNLEIYLRESEKKGTKFVPLHDFEWKRIS